MNKLSSDVTDYIYQLKHQLEYRDCLNELLLKQKRLHGIMYFSRYKDFIEHLKEERHYIKFVFIDDLAIPIEDFFRYCY